MGRHVKRTTVRQVPVPDGWAWVVDYATFDRPSHSRPFEHWAHALVEAQRFEQYKAKSALIERRRRQDRAAQLWSADPVVFPAAPNRGLVDRIARLNAVLADAARQVVIDVG